MRAQTLVPLTVLIFSASPFSALAQSASPQSAPTADFTQTQQQIRNQPAIARSFNLSNLPQSAGAGMRIAILSTGVDPQLQSASGGAISAESVLPSEGWADNNFQGTELVSLVSALSPGARIVSVKIVAKDGNCTFDDVQHGFDRAVSLGASVIVLAVGADPKSNDAALTADISDAIRKGKLVVASAGNAGDAVGYPANVDGVVAVGATDAHGAAADFTNRGGKMIFAPGVDVSMRVPGGHLDTYSSTNVSAALAGAIFADLWSERKKLSAKDLVELIDRTGDSFSIDSSHAIRINAEAAQQSLLKAVRRHSPGHPAHLSVQN